MENEENIEQGQPAEQPVYGEAELAKAQKVSLEKEEDAFDLDDETEGQLTVDVYQTDSDIIVQSTVAGVVPDDLEVNITSESVTVRGTRKKGEKIRDKDYFYQECFWGRFSRSIILPQEVDPDRSKAELKNGILTIRMPKIHRQKAKKLKVSFE